MKKIILFSYALCQITFLGNAQIITQPDTFYYNEFHNDSFGFTIATTDLLSNDSYSGTVKVSDVLVDPQINTSGVMGGIIIEFRVDAGVKGTFACQYEVEDLGSGVKDTGDFYLVIDRLKNEVVSTNEIEANVSAHGLFRYGDNATFLNGNGQHTIFESNLLFYAHNGSTVIDAGRTFGEHSFNKKIIERPVGYANGPVGSMVEPNMLGFDKWEGVWKVTKQQIDDHVHLVGTSGYVVPEAIEDWPGNGDVTKGEPAIIAPFVDVNSNGLYEPSQGDYPMIKGDEAVFFVYNDAKTNGAPQGKIEVHGLVYGFQCGNSALNNTVFVDYKVINRSTNDYTNCVASMFCDGDIGNPMDDYMGSDVDRSLAYLYNGDDVDEDNGGTNGFGNYPPAQGVLTLKGPKLDDDGLDNAVGALANQSSNGSGFGDGIIDNELWGMHSAISAINVAGFDYYYAAYGLSGFGVPLVDTIGGANVVYRHQHSGNTDSQFYGSGGTSYYGSPEQTVQNVPGDRRLVTSSGQFTFYAGDTIELTYAFVRGHDTVNQGAQAGVVKMLANVDAIQALYDNGQLKACGFPTSVKEVEETKLDIQVYPNPTNNIITIESDVEILQVQVFNLSGQLMELTHSKGNQYNLTKLPEGMYMIRVTTSLGDKVLKVVKQ